MKHSVAFVLAGLAMLVGGLGVHLTTDSDVARAGTQTIFSVDADASTGGVDTSAGPIALGTPFSVSVVLAQTSQTYDAFQIEFSYSDVQLDATGFPTSWSDAPVAGTSGGTAAGIWPSGSLCDPSPPSNSSTGEDDSGTATLSMTCASQTFGEQSSYTGFLVQFVLVCEAGGVANLSVSDVNATFVLDTPGGGIVSNDVQNGATVSCAGTAPTDTPVPPTNTPVNFTPAPTGTPIPTSTPTDTPTSTRTPDPDAILITPTPRAGTTGGGTQPPPPGGGGQTPGGAPGGQIGGPDTGSGDGSGGGGVSGVTLALLIAGAGSIALGLTPVGRRVLAHARRARGG